MPTVTLGAGLVLLAGLHLLVAWRKHMSRRCEGGFEKQQRGLLITLRTGFTLAAVLALHLLFYGSSLISQAASSASNDLSYFDQTMTTMVTTAQELPWQLRQSIGNFTLAKESARTFCNMSVTVSSLRQVEGIENIAMSVGPLVASMVRSIQPLVSTARANLHLFGNYYTRLICYVTYCVMMTMLMLFTSWVYCKQATLALAAAFLTQILSLLLISGGSFLLYVLQLSSDFCMDPSKTIVDLLPPTAHVIMVLFSNCASMSITSALLPIIQRLSSFGEALQSKIPPLVSRRCNITGLALMKSRALMNSSVLNLEKTSVALNCDRVSSTYNDLLTKELCGTMMNGASILMGIFYTVGACALCAAALGMMMLPPDTFVDHDTIDEDSEVGCGAQSVCEN